MAEGFKSVNITMSLQPSKDDLMATTPTTPRRASHPLSPQLPAMDDATTPTKASFASSALASQKPLPSSPFPDAVRIPEPTNDDMPKRANSQVSRKSRDSDEMDMDDSEGEGDDGSDDESVNADGTKSKKKKSQRFFCTDYPPCNLSFTRSEHLARHIRKHTGERPFQCHCSRRFSRLDNLRQHAQTVHVNEDIPMDSLAATGTRFQRQIRTDRVRPNGGRSRANTGGSIGAAGRGHSKSLSTSSIASIGSIGSNYSSRDEIRRRPPPLVMATTPQARLSLESYHSAADSQFSYRPPSPGDFSTPTSATFSTGQSSPRWTTIASPSASHSRSHSIYATGARTPGRRLSVPSGGNPFHSPHGANLNRPIFAAAPMNAVTPATPFPPSPVGSLLTSPTTPSSGWLRRDSMSSAADEAWRRRTWHPDSREFVTNSSRLINVITPSAYASNDTPPPIANPPQQQNAFRLPGIESFGPIPGHQPPPSRRAPSPMLVDSEAPPPNPHSLHAIADAASASDERRSWDMGLQRGLNRLDIASTPPRDSAGTWAQEAHQAVQARAEQARLGPPTVRFDTGPQVVQIPAHPPPTSGFARGHAYTMSAPTGTPREYKRHGWYHGPVTVTSSATPVEGDNRGQRVERMVHPNLANGFQGFPSRVPQTVPEAPAEHPGNAESMKRLEALVAIATGEGSTAAAY